ncbi:hypothetical protein M4578_05025 [Salipiger sp. P9]|uniref:hypothetical protein n=1 Tax=Salipiger pentaromativorans TaxID=2943193 RepID=UPI002157F6DA|nr:hypothetical protein [Salipiger pentaromativorans]MCR8547179.1 hypothetical protein [Salipiger pentaromativorans]
MRFISVALFALSLFAAATPARAQDGVFVSYEAMRATLDGLMKARRMGDLMAVFGGNGEMTKEQIASFEVQVRQAYPEDFKDVALVRRQELENGWSQELIAYWTGLKYGYAYVLMQDRGDSFVAVHFRFNTNFAKLNALF